MPNGTGPFVIKEPTLGTFNGTVAAFEPGNFNSSLLLAPNPATESVNVTLQGENIEGQVLVTDAMGRTVLAMDAKPVQTLFVADWPSGVYFLKWHNLTAKLVVK